MEKRRFWESPGFGRTVGFLGLGLLLGFLCAGILVRDWDISTWPWLPTRWNWEVVAQPLATLGAGAFAIGAAGIALHNGNKDREASENRHREEVDLNKEQKLRKRFIEIVSLLSDDSDLTKREAGAYALAALFQRLENLPPQQQRKGISGAAGMPEYFNRATERQISRR